MAYLELRKLKESMVLSIDFFSLCYAAASAMRKMSYSSKKKNKI
jgi:hypothetical protein